MPDQNSRSTGRLLFACLAGLFLVLGIALLVLHGRLGLTLGEAGPIVAALHVTAAADAVIVACWNRLSVARQRA